MMHWSLVTAEITKLDGADFVGVQPSGLGERPGLAPFELLHPYGFASRPVAPDPDGTGCSMLTAEQGSQGFAWLANDPRIQAKLPNLRAGESIQYGPTGQFVRCHEDGSITLATTEDATTDGHSIFLRVSPTVTEPSGRIRGGLEFVSPWGTLTFGPDGFHAIHSSGARLDLGAIGGLPAPLDTMTSYATLTAAVASIQASSVAQGTDGGAAHTAALTALTTLLGVMAAAIDAKAGAPSATAAAVTAAAATIQQIGAVV